MIKEGRKKSKREHHFQDPLKVVNSMLIGAVMPANQMWNFSAGFNDFALCHNHYWLVGN